MSNYDAWLQQLATLAKAAPKTTVRPLGVAARQGSIVPEKPPDAAGRVQQHPSPVAAAPFVYPKMAVESSVTLSRRELLADAKLERAKHGPKEPRVAVQRPLTRGDCEGGDRPCPFVGCRHHTALDVNSTGSLVLNKPETLIEDLEASCSLDVADQGGATLEQVGAVLNVTRERARQLEGAALAHAERAFVPGEVRVFRGSCKAVNAHSGLPCRLPSHAKDVAHHDGRTGFHLVALPDQTVFPGKEKLERAAEHRDAEAAYV